MTDLAKRRERPDKESSVRNRIRDANASKRRERRNFGAESIGPIRSHSSCAKPATPVARRRRELEVRRVIHQIALGGETKSQKRITDSAHEAARSRGRTRRTIHEVKRNTRIRGPMIVEAITQAGFRFCDKTI